MASTSLEELARVLGGVIRVDTEHHWLDTTIGNLRAAVIRRAHPVSYATRYDLAVFMPDARELDPLRGVTHNGMRLDGDSQPRIGHGYLFIGCHAGVLSATSVKPPELEHIIGALWELAELARLPWRAWTKEDEAISRARARRRKLQQQLVRLAFVAIALLFVAFVRR